jgi:hypothetical protein
MFYSEQNDSDRIEALFTFLGMKSTYFKIKSSSCVFEKAPSDQASPGCVEGYLDKPLNGLH